MYVYKKAEVLKNIHYVLQNAKDSTPFNETHLELLQRGAKDVEGVLQMKYIESRFNIRMAKTTKWLNAKKVKSSISA